MALRKPSEMASGGFFKPADHAEHLLLVEPKSLQRDVEWEYQGKAGLRDEITCDVTVFADLAALREQRPDQIMHSINVTAKALVNTLTSSIGDALPFTGCEKTTKGYWIWRTPGDDDPEYQAFVTYYEQRESAISAAMAAAPF
jgi:hypothetical protein